MCEQNSWPNPSGASWQITVCLALRGYLCPFRNMLRTNILPCGVRMIQMLFLVDMNTPGFENQKWKIECFFTQKVILLPLLWLSIFIINVTYVMVKFLLVSSLAYFLWCCVTRTVQYCREFIIFVSYIVFLYTVNTCPSHVHVHVALLPSASYSWLLLTTCVCLLFISCTVWFLINTLPYVMVMIVLILSIFY